MHVRALANGLLHQPDGQLNRFLDGRIVIAELAVHRAVIDLESCTDQGFELFLSGTIKCRAEPEPVLIERCFQLRGIRRASVGVESGRLHRADTLVEIPEFAVVRGLIPERPVVDDDLQIGCVFGHCFCSLSWWCPSPSGAGYTNWFKIRRRQSDRR